MKSGRNVNSIKLMFVLCEHIQQIPGCQAMHDLGMNACSLPDVAKLAAMLLCLLRCSRLNVSSAANMGRLFDIRHMLQAGGRFPGT